ncbi:hypothetical protein SALGADO_45 [Arthrobacter phage Salgado]|uniref:Uncharacterized protein n=2 Tax=Laroyevirus TaxID=1982086 RepID=A0A0U4JDV7_9CAUD|nr:hypothetical protein FDH64_gp44 [Arthrobacter phage Laroye]YP_010082654.1 hypothetical protein KMD22_gp45 [Arthrobacter phage Salgado]ALY09571.1 hypothetical protein LAROYE_44 [Arthrobacter phage Laroye]ALY10213.1 hypothetical protein SALGADO_45 [Arthrobacter phage Salgado]
MRLGRKQRRFYRAARRGIIEGRALIELRDWTLAYNYLQLSRSTYGPDSPFVEALRRTMHKEALKVRIKQCR